MLKFLSGMICLLLSACLVGPHYQEPSKKMATHWKKNEAVVKTAKTKNAAWWRVFQDPTLTALIHQGYQNNLSLQMAAVHVLQTRAQLAQAVGEFYPQQQVAMGSYNYNRIGGTSLQTVLPSNFSTALLGLSSTWELDFWGKYRRAILANDAAFLASFTAYDNALVTLIADVATTYINIRTIEELIDVTKTNIKVQRTGFDIATSRFRAGETSLLDVQQAKTELYQTIATLPEQVSRLQRYKDALAVLLGTTPDKMDGLLAKKKGIPKAPSKIAVGIPKETLVQRPDIYQARLEAIAQSESIGATKANLYPSLSIAGAFAFAANTISGSSISDIFNWSNRNVLAGPSINWPILNYGQITNAVRAQDAVFQQSLLNYLNLILKAQQEVQDDITQFIEAKNAERTLIIANKSAIKSTQLSLIRYREGESDYTTVLDSERQQLRVQTSLTNAKGDIPKALVALYRALGGGWQLRGCNDIVPLKIKDEMAARTNWGNLLQQKNHQPAVAKRQRTKERFLPNW
jgi:NodT family efflux transporter outer membrane factor (OMF) lipoprotein